MLAPVGIATSSPLSHRRSVVPGAVARRAGAGRSFFKGERVKKYLGRKVLWIAANSPRLCEHQIRCSVVRDLSPSGEYVMMATGEWYSVRHIRILEVLDAQGSYPTAAESDPTRSDYAFFSEQSRPSALRTGKSDEPPAQLGNREQSLPR